MGKKLTTLRWFDVVIVTIIMFTEGIYNSTIQFLALNNNVKTLEENLSFSASDNYRALMMQSIWLLLAFLYLYFRKFDFSVWTEKIRLEKWLIVKVVGIFIFVAVLMDIQYMISYNVTPYTTPSMVYPGQGMDISLVLYSLLNGFYEEIFFLGVCLTVNPKYVKWSFLYSLIVRCSFHTYQGLGSAIALGLILGISYYVFYKKMKPQNMLPFFLSHAIADMIGLSVIFYFFQLIQ